MSSLIKPALLTLVALFICVIATIADAAKPGKLQTLTSAPLAGDSCWCYVSNTTEMEIDVDLVISVGSGPIVELTLPVPGKGYNRSGDPLDGDIASCEVSWEGQPDDIRATFCANSYLGSWDDPQTQTCLEMN